MLRFAEGGIFSISLAPAPASTTRSRARLHARRLGAVRHRLRAAADLSGQAAAGRLPARPRGRTASPRSRRPEDMDVQAAYRLPLQRRRARPRERLRARDQPDARPARRLAGRPAVHAIVGADDVAGQDARRRAASSREGTRSSSGSRARCPTSLPGRRCRSSAPSRRAPRRPGRRRRLPLRRAVLRGRLSAGGAGRHQAEPLLRRRAAPPCRRLRRRPSGSVPAGPSISSSAARPTGATPPPASTSIPAGTGKYGVNKSQFFIRPGLTLRVLPLNSSRPLFKDNPSLRRAVNLALNRRALAFTAAHGAGADRSVPALALPGFRDARIYALTSSDVRRAKSLARATRATARRSSTCRTSRRRSRSRSWRNASSPRSASSRAAAASLPCHERELPRPAGRPGERMGHRDHALDAGLHRPVRVRQPAARRPLHRRDESRPLRLAASTTGSCARPARLEGAARSSGTAPSTSTCAQRGAARRDRVPQRADARLEARRLHRAAACARPDRRLPEVAGPTAPARSPRRVPRRR